MRLYSILPRFESGSSSIEVAKVILKSVTSKNPPSELRFMVGDDAFKLMEIRKNKSDKEFRKIVMEGVLK